MPPTWAVNVMLLVSFILQLFPHLLQKYNTLTTRFHNGKHPSHGPIGTYDEKWISDLDMPFVVTYLNAPVSSSR